MIECHASIDGRLCPVPCTVGEPLPPGALWLDVLDPTPEEEAYLEAQLGLDVPTREEMAEIESSSRLHEANGTLYMTVVLICRSDSQDPSTTSVTFIATPEHLITVRYDTPTSFRIFNQRCGNGMYALSTAADVLVALLGTIVDRAADILERVGADLEAVSRSIFRSAGNGARRPRSDLQPIILQVGRSHDVVFRIRESLQSLDRMVAFMRHEMEVQKGSDLARRIRGLETDVRSLGEYDSFLSSKVDFMLDATLGLVGIEQNAIIKIFSVVAVIFMPPTLVASIYGMNFEHMPELDWLLGYPMALGLMLLAAVLPYLFFKMRGWL